VDSILRNKIGQSGSKSDSIVEVRNSKALMDFQEGFCGMHLANCDYAIRGLFHENHLPDLREMIRGIPYGIGINPIEVCTTWHGGIPGNCVQTFILLSIYQFIH
jgi:hypothetical protein